MKKMVITCAITGAETTREHNPNLPISPQELADGTYDAYKAGASIVHIHVRNPDGTPTQDVEIFRETIKLIREKCDIVIETTTGGAVGMSPEERLQPIQLSPDMASLDCGTVNFGDEYIENTWPMMQQFAEEMKKHGVKPTLECFDLGHVYLANKLIETGLLEAPYHFGMVLNVPGALPYTQDNLKYMLKVMPENSEWTVVGIGGKGAMMGVADAIELGGFMRQGFEDNIYFEKGVLADSNAQLIERAANMAKDAGYEIATPADVREIFNLKSK